MRSRGFKPPRVIHPPDPPSRSTVSYVPKPLILYFNLFSLLHLSYLHTDLVNKTATINKTKYFLNKHNYHADFNFHLFNLGYFLFSLTLPTVILYCFNSSVQLISVSLSKSVATFLKNTPLISSSNFLSKVNE